MGRLKMNSHEVFLIVDPSFSGDLWSLSRNAHVWIINSQSNDAAAHAVWSGETVGHSPAAGVTTFRGSSDPSETLYGLLGTIDEHHGQHAAVRPWDKIHVVGLGIDSVSIDRIGDELGLASLRLEVEGNGFVIRRAAGLGASSVDGSELT